MFRKKWQIYLKDCIQSLIFTSGMIRKPFFYEKFKKRFAIIMIISNQQNQNKSKDLIIADRLYKQKFSNSATSGLAERRRIITSQLQQKNDDGEDIFKEFPPKRKPLVSLKMKSKSVGSLLPKIAELQTIAKSQNISKNKQKNNSLSNLQIYLSQKNIKKQEQYNILFLTQTMSVLSDKIINQKFNQFIALSRHNAPKNLRALLNLAEGTQLTQQSKKRKIENQKQELKGIVKDMLERQVNSRLKVRQDQQNAGDKKQQESQEQSEHHQDDNKKKNIEWVIGQCDKYNKKRKNKFKIRKAEKESRGQSMPSTI